MKLQTRQRGSAYLVLLGAATLLTILGLSGLLAARIELRGTRAGEAAAQARVGAASTMELALLRVGSDDLWRKKYQHNTWTTEETIAGAACSYKLVCQVDSLLDSHEVHPTRLYAKARVGDATRIYSVLIEDANSALVNRVSNGDIEAGAANWDAVGWYGAAYLNLAASTDSPYAGKQCLRAYDRKITYVGPTQEVTAKIQSGTTYTMTAQVRMNNNAENVLFGLYLELADGGVLPVYSTQNARTTWTTVSDTFTPTWSGELKRAFLAFGTQVSTQDFYVDNVTLTGRDVDTPLVVRPVPGTWRREPAW